jgi:hypothetical protein
MHDEIPSPKIQGASGKRGKFPLFVIFFWFLPPNRIIKMIFA